MRRQLGGSGEGGGMTQAETLSAMAIPREVK